MSEDALEGWHPAVPRWIAGILIAVIALASLAALVWPSLLFPAARGPPDVGAIRAQVDEPEAAGRIGSHAPNFEWNAPGGKLMRLSDLRGNVVMINFWATWRVPCRQELPALNRVAESSPDIVFLEIDLQEWR